MFSIGSSIPGAMGRAPRQSPADPAQSPEGHQRQRDVVAVAVQLDHRRRVRYLRAHAPPSPQLPPRVCAVVHSRVAGWTLQASCSLKATADVPIGRWSRSMQSFSSRAAITLDGAAHPPHEVDLTEPSISKCQPCHTELQVHCMKLQVHYMDLQVHDMELQVHDMEFQVQQMN